MKRMFAVALLVVSFASVALADGSGMPPTTSTKPPKPAVVQLADGGGMPPTGTVAKPTQLADGGGMPPTGTVAKPTQLADGGAMPPAPSANPDQSISV
jgi:hypothetical protein